MKPFTDLFPLVLPFAPSVPDPVAVQYIRQAAIDFCNRSRSWRDVQDIDIAGDEAELLPVPGQATLAEIEAAWFRQGSTTKWTPLRRVPYREVDQSLLEIAPTDKTLPSVIAQVDFSNSVVLAPRAPGSLRISMFLIPSRDAEYGPDHLFANFAQVIADGALSSILMIPDQPYTNPNLAALKAGIFNAACDASFNLNIRGQQRAPARTRASFF